MILPPNELKTLQTVHLISTPISIVILLLWLSTPLHATAEAEVFYAAGKYLKIRFQESHGLAFLMASQLRTCPYCGEILKKPYWVHVQTEHPDEYNNSKDTWKQLFQDYKDAGMDDDISIKVVSELFNADPADIRKLLTREGLL